MKNAKVAAARLAALLQRLRRERGATPPSPPAGSGLPPLEQLVFSFLLWEAPQAKALAAYRRLLDRVVDCNDLRVCLDEEIVAAIGEKYPFAAERTARLKAVLHAVHRRHHAVTLDDLIGMRIEDARSCLTRLDGMPPFVAARVRLVCLGDPVVPVDERLHRLLTRRRILSDPATGVAEVEAWLTRRVKPSEAATVHSLLMQWADEAEDGEAARGGTAKPRGASERDPEHPKPRDAKPGGTTSGRRAPSRDQTLRRASGATRRGVSGRRPAR